MPRPRKLEKLAADELAQIEGDWRAGVMSIRVVAAKHRLDPDALRNFATRAGWVRGDLSDAINVSTNRALVDQTIAYDQRVHGDDRPVVATAEETVERYGQLAADIVGSHRSDVARGRLQASRLERALYRLVDSLASSTDDPRERLSLIRSAAETLRCLATTMKTFVEIERQAWGLDKPEAQAPTYDDLLAELYGENEPVVGKLQGTR
jgi:hypothetical protein